MKGQGEGVEPASALPFRKMPVRGSAERPIRAWVDSQPTSAWPPVPKQPSPRKCLKEFPLVSVIEVTFFFWVGETRGKWIRIEKVASMKRKKGLRLEKERGKVQYSTQIRVGPSIAI